MNLPVVQRASLSFRLGEKTLFAIRKRVCVLNTELFSGQAPEPLRFPEQVLPDDCDGFMMRACPVAVEPPVVSRARGLLAYVSQIYTHCYIDLQMGFAAYCAGFSAKTRSTINRKVKKFRDISGRGDAGMVRYATATALPEFFRLAGAVSALSYQERLLSVGLPRDIAAQERACRQAAANQLRAYVLFLGERPVAYLYCPAEQGVVKYAYLGYDPEFAGLSPGTVLQWLALESLFAEGEFRVFDFTEGDSPHKRLFSSHQRTCVNAYFFRDTFGHRVLVASHRAMNAVSTGIGALLDRLGVKAKLKKMLRR